MLDIFSLLIVPLLIVGGVFVPPEHEIQTGQHAPAMELHGSATGRSNAKVVSIVELRDWYRGGRSPTRTAPPFFRQGFRRVLAEHRTVVPGKIAQMPESVLHGNLCDIDCLFICAVHLSAGGVKTANLDVA